MSFGSKICKYQDEILSDLAKLVAIPSVKGEEKEGMPYGENSAKALACILKIADDMGLKTKNVGGYAGHAEYGEGEELAAVLAHIDVVPAGEGWETDPFTMTQKGSLVFGRGTADDKGAAIVALYCLKVLKEEGIVPKRRLRVIFGAGEETGMDDLETYFKTEPLPQMGFTPDAEYGICNREKGILHFSIEGKNDSDILYKLYAGKAVNAVPDKATAEIFCSPTEFENLKEAVKTIDGEFEFEKTEQGAKITAHGRAAHACMPQAGLNAASQLLLLLEKVFGSERIGSFCRFLQKKIGLETDGKSFAVNFEDEPSGALTLNLGILKIEDGCCYAGVDIRYPVTIDGEKIIGILKEGVEAERLEFCVDSHNPPLYLPEDSRLISLLKDSYREITGTEAKMIAMGGGTYARTILGRGVAFGPFFEEEPDRRLHNANEHIDIAFFMKHAQVCLEAMYRMLIA